jgi:hypothetical protein
MSNAIEDYLGVSKSRPYPDLIWDGVNVPNSDSTASDGFYAGEVQTALEIVVAVNEEVAVNNGQTLIFTYEHGTDFTESVPIRTINGEGSGGSVFAAGTELVRFVPPTSVPSLGRLKMTTNDTTAGKVDAWPELISR